MVDNVGFGERMIFNFESVGVIHNKKERVYKNKIALPIFDSPPPLIEREIKAKQIETLLKTMSYDRRGTSPQLNFRLIPSIGVDGEQKTETTINGILLTNKTAPQHWNDYDIYTSKALHPEIARVATHSDETILVGDPRFPSFDIHYVSDPITSNRLFLADFRRLDGGYDLRMEAVLRILKPTYYFYRDNKYSDTLQFKANKFL